MLETFVISLQLKGTRGARLTPAKFQYSPRRRYSVSIFLFDDRNRKGSKSRGLLAVKFFSLTRQMQQCKINRRPESWPILPGMQTMGRVRSA
jgi:hypothetical protein